MTTPSYRLDHKRSHELKIAASTRTTESSTSLIVTSPILLSQYTDPIPSTLVKTPL
ncbi:hypothetical protein PGT21_010549 [Puccinia graminis f. sp. tritici]|uniref:Uncharacterized protein n=1 Tax=Puccinia graminis f. sp. tritici TaxID=56615 RepID=A0A5B0QNK9_PUCGR|nr:hypothetical protein PGT21_010549 [Puccinia graminis f. sp. tritici]